MAIEGRKQHVRMDPKERKAQLLEAALKLAEKFGAENVTRKMVGDKTKTTDGLVTRYFGTTKKLHAAIKSEATKRKVRLPEGEAVERLRRKLWTASHPNASHRAKPTEAVAKAKQAERPRSAGKTAATGGGNAAKKASKSKPKTITKPTKPKASTKKTATQAVKAAKVTSAVKKSAGTAASKKAKKKPDGVQLPPLASGDFRRPQIDVPLLPNLPPLPTE